MPQLAFVMSPGQDWVTRELVETVRYELDLQGIPSTLHEDGFPAPSPDGVYALAGARQYQELRGADALPDESILGKTVFIGAQAPSAPFDEEELETLRGAGAVFEIDVRTVLRLRRAGIPARTLRPGYSRLRDHFDPDAARPIDVMFLAAASPRRLELLARYAPILSRYNCHIQLADGEHPNPAGSSSFLAESKYDLMRQAKVVINLHRGEDPELEWLRVIEAMHCGAVVVSEHSAGLAPFTPGEHLLTASADALAFVVQSVLRDPSRQQQLRVQAYERLSTWLPFALSISVLRAALVELVGQPVPPDAFRGARSDPPPGPWGRWNPVAVDVDPEVVRLQRQAGRAAAEVGELRHQLTRLQQMVLADAHSGTSRTAYESAAWRALRAPRATAIVAVEAGSRRLMETLDSLATSRLRGLEIVITASGCTAGTLAAIERWLRAHPRLATRLVISELDGGRGASLNIAVDHTRSPYCLVLDPGAELYPQALDALCGTLDGLPEVSFVYPMAEVLGPSRGSSLVNVFGWEPGRLRLGGYIYAPYVVRKERIREIGGFTDDARLRNWEDYALWGRMAALGRRGQLVPQILARRPPPPAEQLALTGPEATVGLTALSEIAPELFADMLLVY